MTLWCSITFFLLSFSPRMLVHAPSALALCLESLQVLDISCFSDSARALYASPAAAQSALPRLRPDVNRLSGKAKALKAM